MKNKDYDKALDELYIQLVDLQRWIIATGKRVVVVFEGRDAAGKGGVIKAISGPLNTRYTRIVALPKPSEREATEWYFQRYIEHLPSAGELVLFDRSWYNRAGVERVMGFCSDEQYRRFLADCPVFEKLITEDGLILIKYWLAVDQAEQELRFDDRASDPLKRWKISPIDIKAREQYDAYGRARDAMLRATDTKQAPVVRRRFQRPEARPAQSDPPPARPVARARAGRSAAQAAASFGQARQGTAAREAVLDSVGVLMHAGGMDVRSSQLHLTSTSNIRCCFFGG